MFEAIIIAVAEGLTLECGKSILARVRMFIKKCRIKKALVKKINSDILSKCASAAYYNALDKFLSEEDFANKIVKYSFEPSSMPISTLREYIKYLAEKFIQNNPSFLYEKSRIYSDLNTFSKIIFDIINDYSKDETARLVISQFKKTLGETIAPLQESVKSLEKNIDKLASSTRKDDKTVDFDDESKIEIYKSSMLAQYIFEDAYISRNIYTGNDDAKSSVTCLLRDKRIILLGNPGCGKTYESINILREFCSSKTLVQYIPVYMRLREYGTVYKSLCEYIEKQLQPYWGNITEEKVMEELKIDRFALILDGVDEITNSEYRIKFFSEINLLLSCSNSLFFVTSRTNPYHGNINGVKSYCIKDLTQEQIRQELQESGIHLSVPHQYYELFANPLFLNIGKRVLANSGRSKLYNKSQLFNAYLEEVCYKRDKTKLLTTDVQKNYHNILMSVGHLAFEKFEKPFLSIAEFDAFFSVEGKDYTVDNICDVFRIDIFRVSNNISFSHKQFKEFLAAYYLTKKYLVTQNGGLYLSLMSDQNWQEVMVFAAGLISDIDEQNAFLDMILKINLKTYIACVKYKNDLSYLYQELSYEEYSKKYLEVLYQSYIGILESYFSNIKEQFEPFSSRDVEALKGKKICLTGSLSPDRKHLQYWFDWKDETEDAVQIINENDMPESHKDFEMRAIREARRIISHWVNLDLSNLMGDSARKVALDLIENNLEEMTKSFRLVDSDYILYEKLRSKTKRISALKDKSIEEILQWCLRLIEEEQERCTNLRGYIYNGVELFDVLWLAKVLVTRGKSEKALELPQGDQPFKHGWIWETYSTARTIERLQMFFLWRQQSFEEMVEYNFPRMKEYFARSKDSPYRYKIHLKFNAGEGFSSHPSITYYYLSIRDGESKMPEVVVCDNLPQYNEGVFDVMAESFYSNGKEGDHMTISTTGFDMTLISRGSGEPMPLTSVVYDDFKSAFKELFEK